MTLRDRSLIAAFALLFLASSAAALMTSGGPGSASPSPEPTVPVARRYVEGVLGHATNASPFGARSSADRELVALLFRGLVKLGPDQTIVGDLASSWDVDPSGNTWTFHLRPGLHWQDGQPLTADDVVFTIQALADPTYDGPNAASWREVSASASDADTVSLRLATPLGGFLQAATQPIAPKHLLGTVPPAQLANDPFGLHPVGSGPFQLIALDSHRAVVDAPSDATAAPGEPATPSPSGSPEPVTEFPSPYLAGIEFEYFDDVASLQAAWQRGELDGASGLAPSDAATLGAQAGARLVRYPSSQLLALVPNLRPGHTTYADPKVRKALLEALDRNAILADPLLGFGVQADSLIPPWAPEFDAASSPIIPFDASAAQAALTAAGWTRSDAGWTPKGAKTPVQVTLLSADLASNPIAFEAAEDVVKAWQAIGLTVVHESVAASDLLTGRVEPGTFDIALVPLVIGLDPDLYPLLASSQTRTGGANLAGLQDPTLDGLLAAARAPGSPDARAKAYQALQQRLSATLPILPLVFRDDVVVFRDTVAGPSPRPIGGPGDRFWDVLTWRLAQAPTSS